MKARRMLSVPTAVALVVLAGCTGGGPPADPTPSAGATAATPSSATNQLPSSSINAVARDSIADGGELRVGVGPFGSQWNLAEIDGDTTENATIMDAMVPNLFVFDAAGEPTPDPDYLNAVSAGGTSPQVVTYTLNPKAVWGNGRPFDWTDFEAEWKACRGQDTGFRCASTQGFSSIASVVQGADAQQAVVTYRGAYPDWANTFQHLFAKEGLADADTFNAGWTDVTKLQPWLAGPFQVEAFDRTQGILTLVPNTRWWADPPKLSRLSFLSLAPAAQSSAFADHRIDAFDVGPDAALSSQAAGTADGEIRTATGGDFRQIILNSDRGALKDLPVRQAISRGLNRQTLAAPVSGTIMNNHVFAPSQNGYQDNAAPAGMTSDATAARKLLTDDGYTMQADGYLGKDTSDLSLTLSTLAGSRSAATQAQSVQAQLKAIGIKITITTVPGADFAGRSTLTGHDFDLVILDSPVSTFPMSTITPRYGTGQNGNFGQLSIPQLDAISTRIDVETDRTKRVTEANQADRLLWLNAPTIPLYQRTQAVATKKTLANFGAFGRSSIDWSNVGYTG